ncbi:MAG: hypothetical protein QF489_10065 [Planctomycetota bacterium]|jgi:hypothetical protein|nr:hypothetical protein [Planctomycetota bacterium]
MLLETLFCTILGASGNAATGDLAVPMSHKRYRDWTIELPKETFTTVGSQIELADGKYVFATKMEGTNLLLDLDADGQTDVRITGLEGSALLRHEDGFRYAVRLKRNANGWAYAASGAQVGKLDGKRLALIDQDNDGIFGEVGQDAILIGQGKIATWLGDSILLDGKLHALKLDADGGQLELSPYEGETGQLSVVAGFNGQGKLMSAVVRSLDAKHCFDLAGEKGPVQVPMGEYRIVSGKIGLGEQAVMVAPGWAPAIQVRKGEEQVVNWGGPVRAEFAFQRDGQNIAFSPEAVWYYGSTGEEYVNWKPVGKSPIFKVIDSASQQEVARAIFPGSC